MAVHEVKSDRICGWSADGCCDTLDAKFNGSDADKALAQSCLDTAAEILYGLSGRQFGVCELTVRPCRTACCDPCTGSQFSMSGYRWTPVLIGGEWTNVSCGGCGDSCSCSEVCELKLPGPIDSIVEVKQDGLIVPLDQFRVDNRSTIVRLDGNECWPTCQDMGKPDTEAGTYSIKYNRGVPLPSSGRSALAEFACEICKACIGDDTCCLPKRVTSISRQGISMAILDPMPFLEKGRTGLYLVDAWLAAVNPKARVRAAGVYSPDMPQSRRTTWP